MTGDASSAFEAPTPCSEAVHLAQSYQPYSSGKVLCRRRAGHAGDHVATLMCVRRGRLKDIRADLTWPNAGAEVDAHG